MMKAKEIEHYDTFDNATIFWCVATNIPLEYVEEAKKIDRENYSPDCFGICVVKDEEEGFYICQDAADSELYYVDNAGEKHWLKRTLNEEEANTFYELCKNEAA